MEQIDYCLNCTTNLKAHDNFCHTCGQKVLKHRRITMGHITHEVVHAMTHADKGFFYLIKELATAPGITIKQYLAGKHKKFFNPFSFFFIVLGLYVLSNSVFKPFDHAMNIAGQENTRTNKYPPYIKTEKQKAKYKLIELRKATAMNFMNTKTNIVLCISTPFIALIMFLLYRRHLYYAEQLVVMTFINTFLNLLSISIFTPLIYFFGNGGLYQFILMTMILTHIVYISIVYYRVLSLPATWGNYLKCLASAFFAVFCWTLLCGTAIFAYMSYGILYFK